MFTIQEMQAMDYLLKWLLKQDRFPFVDKNLKLVINVHGTNWTGDFINYSKGDVQQFYIDDAGDVENCWLYSTGSNATAVFHKIRETYNMQMSNLPYGNPFAKINNLSLLFNTLTKLVRLAEIEKDDSPVYPYLLNAKSLDGKLELPFINLDGETIAVVSIVELKDER